MNIKIVNQILCNTVKPVLSVHSKINKNEGLLKKKTNGSLMNVESIAAFCNTFDLR